MSWFKKKEKKEVKARKPSLQARQVEALERIATTLERSTEDSSQWLHYLSNLNKMGAIADYACGDSDEGIVHQLSDIGSALVDLKDEIESKEVSVHIKDVKVEQTVHKKYVQEAAPDIRMN